MKKLLALGLFLAVVVCSIAVISAESASEEVTFDGIKFKIPQGYKAVEQEQDTNQSDEIHDIEGIIVDAKSTHEYENDSGDELEFEIGTLGSEKIDIINPDHAEKKKFADKEGFIIKDKDNGKDKYKFIYIQGDKVVKIAGVSEEVIAQAIV
jgi:hypothetical protein